MEKKLLEVGDVLYCNDRWQGLVRIVIDKVTNKQAMAGTKKFYRELLTMGSARCLGQFGSMKLETPELKAEFQLQNLRRKADRLLKSYKVQDLPTEKLLEIIKVLSDNENQPTP